MGGDVFIHFFIIISNTSAHGRGKGNLPSGLGRGSQYFFPLYSPGIMIKVIIVVIVRVIGIIVIVTKMMIHLF